MAGKTTMRSWPVPKTCLTFTEMLLFRVFLEFRFFLLIWPKTKLWKGYEKFKSEEKNLSVRGMGVFSGFLTSGH